MNQQAISRGVYLRACLIAALAAAGCSGGPKFTASSLWPDFLSRQDEVRSEADRDKPAKVAGKEWSRLEPTEQPRSRPRFLQKMLADPRQPVDPFLAALSREQQEAERTAAVDEAREESRPFIERQLADAVPSNRDKGFPFLPAGHSLEATEETAPQETLPQRSARNPFADLAGSMSATDARPQPEPEQQPERETRGPRTVTNAFADGFDSQLAQLRQQHEQSTAPAFPADELPADESLVNGAPTNDSLKSNLLRAAILGVPPGAEETSLAETSGDAETEFDRDDSFHPEESPGEESFGREESFGDASSFDSFVQSIEEETEVAEHAAATAAKVDDLNDQPLPEWARPAPSLPVEKEFPVAVDDHRASETRTAPPLDVLPADDEPADNGVTVHAPVNDEPVRELPRLAAAIPDVPPAAERHLAAPLQEPVPALPPAADVERPVPAVPARVASLPSIEAERPVAIQIVPAPRHFRRQTEPEVQIVGGNASRRVELLPPPAKVRPEVAPIEPETLIRNNIARERFDEPAREVARAAEPLSHFAAADDDDGSMIVETSELPSEFAAWHDPGTASTEPADSRLTARTADLTTSEGGLARVAANASRVLPVPLPIETGSGDTAVNDERESADRNEGAGTFRPLPLREVPLPPALDDLPDSEGDTANQPSLEPLETQLFQSSDEGREPLASTLDAIRWNPDTEPGVEASASKLESKVVIGLSIGLIFLIGVAAVRRLQTSA